MPPLKAFMDDKTVIQSEEAGSREILETLDDLIVWARMLFKPKKSRSLSLRKGVVEPETRFHIAGQHIPTVSEEPVKSLGRWYDESLKDTKQRDTTVETLAIGLKKIDHCPLQGRHKVWCLQHVLIPMLLWPLLVYEIAVTTVEAMEAKINRFTRKWLGLPPGLSDVALYSRQSKLKLPFKSIIEEYKAGKTRLQLMLEDSKDPLVRNIQPTLRSGRKFKTSEAVEEARRGLAMREVMGHTQTTRQGLGMTSMRWYSQTKGKERRDMVIDEIKKKEQSARYTKAVQQPMQGQWTNWDDALQRSLSWSDIWSMAPLRLSFIIRSTYDVLPSNTNLVLWGKADDPNCPLCMTEQVAKPQTMEHVLSSCPVALADQRYTWRHNRVLEELTTAINTNLTPETTNKPYVAFVNEKGETWKKNKELPNREAVVGRNLLGFANGWQVAADLPNWRAAYPEAIRQKNQKPDLVVWSEEDSHIIMIELSVPYESRIDDQHQFKTRKYEDLVRELRSEGYTALLRPVEVGARGFVGASMCQLLSQLGIRGHRRTKILKKLSEVAEKSSSWLWTMRNSKWR